MLKYTCLGNNRVRFECKDWQSLGEIFGAAGSDFYKSFPKYIYRALKPAKIKVLRSPAHNLSIKKKKSCPYCKKKFKNVDYHVSVVHGERWDEHVGHLKANGTFSSTLRRCRRCGVLTKNLSGHMKKAHMNGKKSANCHQ